MRNGCDVMVCPLQSRDNADVLLEYCARRLSREASLELERHLEFCAECRDFASGQRMVWESLDAWDAAPVSLDFDRRLYRKIEEQRVPRWWITVWEPLRSSLKPVTAVAAVFLAVAAIATVDPPRGLLSSSATQTTETVEIEQVETALEDMEMLQQLEVLARQDVSQTESAPAHTL